MHEKLEKSKFYPKITVKAELIYLLCIFGTGLSDWLIDFPIDWLINCLVDWFIDWLIDWLIGWLIDWVTT